MTAGFKHFVNIQMLYNKYSNCTQSLVLATDTRLPVTVVFNHNFFLSININKSSLKVQINKTRTNFISIYKVKRSLVQRTYLLSLV